jgi:hypothetical protein
MTLATTMPDGITVSDSAANATGPMTNRPAVVGRKSADRHSD